MKLNEKLKYWWETKTRKNIIGKSITCFSSEGCQAINEFQWLGKAIGFEYNKKLNCAELVIKIIKHNHSYTDSRENSEELYKHPLVNADIQNVDGIYILFK